MEAIVENAPKFLVNNAQNTEMLITFTYILQIANKAKDEFDLKKLIHDNYQENRYFIMGFCGSHMWVKQKDLPSTNEKFGDVRNIIVKFI